VPLLAMLIPLRTWMDFAYPSFYWNLIYFATRSWVNAERYRYNPVDTVTKNLNPTKLFRNKEGLNLLSYIHSIGTPPSNTFLSELFVEVWGFTCTGKLEMLLPSHSVVVSTFYVVHTVHLPTFHIKKNQQNALIKLQYNISQNTLHIRSQILHVSASTCYHRGVSQQQRFVDPLLAHTSITKVKSLWF